jgi:hypothetical protein
MGERAPNMGTAAEIIAENGEADKLETLDRRIRFFLEKTGSI